MNCSRTTRRWIAAVPATCLALVLPLIASSSVSPARAATSSSGPDAVASTSRSGLPWPSGVYIPGKNPADHADFAAYRGADTDVVLTWAPRRSWADLNGAEWMYRTWGPQPQTAVYTFPPFPEDGVSNLASCAGGAYDEHWRTIGRQLQNSGSAHKTVLRLGWEFNGDWYPWAAKNPSQFVGCWRHVHDAVEAYAPGVRWDWTVNRGPNRIGIDARDAYPGDAYVDVVSVDSYDWYAGALDEETWQGQYAGPFGLKSWADFARTHGKRLGVPEWGVHPGTRAASASGGDNAFYIKKMVSFFYSQRDNLAYETYFNADASYYGGSLHAPVQVPLASAEYARQVRALRNGTVPPPPTPVVSNIVFDAHGVNLSTPGTKVRAGGVDVTAQVQVNRTVTFAKQVRVAIRDSAGRSWDSRGGLDTAFGPWTLRAGTQLSGSRALAPGSYSAFLTYSIDGQNWVSGSKTTFTVQ